MSEEVRRMFASISNRYDLLNSVLSMRMHHSWRKKTVQKSGVKKGMSVLDCATGTGDMAIAFKKAVGPGGSVIGTDFCPEMLEYAPEKSRITGLKIIWEIADVMDLPYENDRFDISSIAFGIRNVDDPVIALSEMARVVKSGGKVVVLEFGQPRRILKYPFRWYGKYVIPLLGGWISGNRKAYHYLPETSASFPADEAFIKMMKEAGTFQMLQSIPLMQGIAYIYTGTVL